MLTLYNVTEAESGEYVCKVSNYIGEANQSAWLTVTRPLATGNRKDARWGVSSHRRSPAAENKTLGSLVSAVFLVPQAMEKHSAGPAGFVLCVCVPVCPRLCCPPVPVLVSPAAGRLCLGWFLHAAHGQHVPMGRTLSLVKGF